MTRWESGQDVLPVDLPRRSNVRAAFTEAVHGRSVGAIRAYWQRQVFWGRGVSVGGEDVQRGGVGIRCI